MIGSPLPIQNQNFLFILFYFLYNICNSFDCIINYDHVNSSLIIDNRDSNNFCQIVTIQCSSFYVHKRKKTYFSFLKRKLH